MTRAEVKNLAASVRQRLANLAQAQKEDFQQLLSRYARERLLYRLSVSDYRERFILKGALLFAYWTGAPHRPTRDMDLLSHGAPDIELLEKVFRDLCQQEVQPDGFFFLVIQGEYCSLYGYCQIICVQTNRLLSITFSNVALSKFGRQRILASYDRTMTNKYWRETQAPQQAGHRTQQRHLNPTFDIICQSHELELRVLALFGSSTL